MENSEKKDIQRGLRRGLYAAFIYPFAYIIYSNVIDMPIGASFFWFMLFSFLTILALARKGQPASAVWANKKTYKFVIADIILLCLTFVCILTGLQQEESAIALTVITLLILRAPLTAALGVWICGDKVKRWGVFILGTIVLISSLLLYRVGADLFSGTIQAGSFIDVVFLLSLGMVVFGAIDAPIRRRCRNRHNIQVTNILRFTFAGTTIFGFFWMMSEAYLYGELGFVWPTGPEWIALIFLGIVPTAYGNKFSGEAEDALGMPLASILQSLQTVFAFFIGLTPIWFLVSDYSHLTITHYVGMVIAVLSVIYVFRYAGVEKYKPPQQETPQ